MMRIMNMHFRLSKSDYQRFGFEKIADLVKTRIEVFPDITEKIDFFEELPEYDVAMYTHKKMKTNSENSLEVLNEMLPRLEALPDFSFENVEKSSKRLCG